MYTTLFLDIDNTLLDFHACSHASLQTTFSACGLAFTDAVFPVFEEVNNALWREVELGTLTREELHAVRFPRLFARLGVAGDGVAAERLFRSGLAESHVEVPGATALLRYLYPRYRLCAASNSARAQQLRRLYLAGMLPYFSRVFVSEDMSCEKPRPGFFDGCFARLPGVRREQVLLIGDSLSADIRGGADSGLRTCWYNPDHLPLPSDVRPEYTVSSLAEICSFL